MRLSSRFGQARIIEAVMASILIFIVFTAAFYMLFSSEKFFRQEAVDLNRLAYNVLHLIAESGVIEEAIEGGSEMKLMNLLQSLLPQGIYFNLTIYKRDDLDQWSRVLSLYNAPPEIFERSSETASAGIIYTSRRLKIEIYYLNLVLTRAGLT